MLDIIDKFIPKTKIDINRFMSKEDKEKRYKILSNSRLEREKLMKQIIENLK